VNAADRLVLVTTRNRPHMVAAVAEYWASTGKVVIYVDREDPAMPAYVDACEQAGVEILVGSRFGIRDVAERYADSYAAVIVVDDHATHPGQGDAA
jgi:acyl-coenzyme A synthetase/AMP-(fatty) acid ligase